MTIVGLDIGGANLKSSDSYGNSRIRAFPLWKHPHELAHNLRGIIEINSIDGLAVTMTGELADCFRTKSEGVDCILGAVEEVACGKPVMVWQTAGEFVSPDVARDSPELVAAANWHLLATFAGRFVAEGNGLLIDIGSTTTDVIPLCDGLPNSHGRTDRERLSSGELVYSGVKRTPLCAIGRDVRLGESTVGLAAEVFATMHDVYIWRNDVAQDEADCETANGRPATRDEAAERLARMICCDCTEVSNDELDEMCRQLAQRQYEQIEGAVSAVVSRSSIPPRVVLVSGSGEFLALRIARNHADLRQAEVISLTSAFGASISSAACAFAAASLLKERNGLFRK
ncbi:MAG: H4MPT-linked C1 transfer pathway protein [Planctomycetota bacterium]|nr:H4MPT-linked C1 transfer pathway protein [Planctomycetota bacterium]MDA1211922.1 H4MPT-linked C1 transfer pathway protein [Planctomycetota bacterium]